jgi:hypothetical protein
VRQAVGGPLVNPADVVARVNPAVVNVDATSRSRGGAVVTGLTADVRRAVRFRAAEADADPRPRKGTGFITAPTAASSQIITSSTRPIASR